jgi:hypothetical protein
MRLNSHVHLIPLTLQLQTEPEQNRRRKFSSRSNFYNKDVELLPYFKFPTHYKQHARNNDSSIGTDNIRPTHMDTTNNTTDALETTILEQSQTQTTSALCHPATKNYTATDIMKNKTTRFSIPLRFLNSKTAASTSCNSFYFIPIYEKAHELRPTLIDSNDFKIYSTKCNISCISQDLDIARK